MPSPTMKLPSPPAKCTGVTAVLDEEGNPPPGTPQCGHTRFRVSSIVAEVVGPDEEVVEVGWICQMCATEYVVQMLDKPNGVTVSVDRAP